MAAIDDIVVVAFGVERVEEKGKILRGASGADSWASDDDVAGASSGDIRFGPARRAITQPPDAA